MFAKVHPKEEEISSKDVTTFTQPVFKVARWILLLGAINPGSPSPNRNRCSVTLKNIFIANCMFFFLIIVSVSCYDLHITISRSEDFARKLSFTVIFASSAYLTMACSIVMSQNLSRLEDMFYSFEKRFGVSRRVSEMPRYFRLSIIWLIFNVASSLAVQAFFLTRSFRLFCGSVPLCNIPQPWYSILFPVYVVMFTIAYLQWQGLFLVSAFFAIFYAREFDQLNENFKELIKSQDETEVKFNHLVEKHNALVNLLDVTNTCTQHFSFLGLFLLIPVNSFFLYSSLDNIDNSLEMSKLLSGMFASLSVLGIRLILEARVNRKAHGPLEYLWQLRKELFCERGLHQLSMFMNRLMGESIGYNIFGILTINMQNLLAIFGTLTTYIIIVFQFRPIDPPCQCDCMKNVSYCIMDQ